MKEGVVAGYPVHNVGVSVFDGKEHPVDSKPIAFEIAGRAMFREAHKASRPKLLEPIMRVEVVTESDYLGEPMEPRASRIYSGEDTRWGLIINTWSTSTTTGARNRTSAPLSSSMATAPDSRTW